ncbi:MAG: S-layer homology domain-containing protein [Clostridiales bacterium]|nr:S-layer homology domain-containing protein [Clostridiales bacterium]
MKKDRIKYIFSILVILVFTNSILVFANTKTNEEIKAYEDGFTWGKNTGYIYGQKDYLNGKKADWENAYKLEKGNIVKDYNLGTKKYTYRNNFLEGYKEGFQLAYNDVYDRPNVQIDESFEDLASRHGAYFGSLLARKHAVNHAYLNKISDWNRDIPVDTYIIKQYRLENDTRSYSDAFIKAYKDAYRNEYQKAYSEFNYDRERILKENAFRDGRDQGETAGFIQAMIDFVQGKTNDWNRALYEFEAEKNLVTRYTLNRENNEYILGFINGFRDGFMKGYSEYYQDFSMELGKRNINYKRISMLEDIIKFEDEFYNIINGVRAKESRITAQLYIPAGSIYAEVYMYLQKEDMPITVNSSKYIPVTKVYDIGVVNDRKKVNLYKPLTLSFEYFGSSRAGIYKLVDNEWKYIYSDIEDGKISAEISDKIYEGGKYIVMIDENYVEIRDISRHWARKELYTYLRRGYIKGDKEQKFNPDNQLTRRELSEILSKVNKWDISAKDIISNKPDAHITYEEIESIMEKITGNDNFNWDKFAEDMMYKKYTRSQSYLGKTNKISKAEVVYMLHELEKSEEI